MTGTRPRAILAPTTWVMRGVLALAAMLVIAPVLTTAGVFDSCCVKCKKVRVKCCCPRFCPPPAPILPQYKMVPVTEQVPVTTFDTVCVDEGAYKQVWVPKVVAKQVPRTVMTSRTSWHRVQVNPCPTNVCPPGVGTFAPGAVPAGAVPGSTYPGSTYPGSTYPGSTYPGPTIEGQGGAGAAVPNSGVQPTFSNEAFTTPGLSAPSLGAPSATPNSVTPMPMGGFGTTGADRLVPMPTDSGNATPILPKLHSGSASSNNAPTPILPKAAAKPSSGASAGLFSAPPSAAMVWRSQINATR